MLGSEWELFVLSGPAGAVPGSAPKDDLGLASGDVAVVGKGTADPNPSPVSL